MNYSCDGLPQAAAPIEADGTVIGMIGDGRNTAN
jgi:hypothetical protein